MKTLLAAALVLAMAIPADAQLFGRRQRTQPVQPQGSIMCYPMQQSAAAPCVQTAPCGQSGSINGETIAQLVRMNYYQNHLLALQAIATNTEDIATEVRELKDDQGEDLDAMLQIFSATVPAITNGNGNGGTPPAIMVVPQSIVPQSVVPQTIVPNAQGTSYSPSFPAPRQQNLILPQPMASLPFERLQVTRQRSDCPDGTCNLYSQPVQGPYLQGSKPLPSAPVQDAQGNWATPVSKQLAVNAKVQKESLPRATVRVRSTLQSLERLGSGVHIGDNYVLTCAHALKRGWNPTVIDTKHVEWPARIVAADALRDIGLLKVEHEGFNAQVLKVKEYSPKKDDRVSLSGMQDGHRVWPGKVAGYFGGDVVIENSQAKKGDSGGPICVQDGVVSLISEHNGQQRVSFGPNNTEVREFLDHYLKQDGIRLAKHEEEKEE